jgi:hypothetical protein
MPERKQGRVLMLGQLARVRIPPWEPAQLPTLWVQVLAPERVLALALVEPALEQVLAPAPVELAPARAAPAQVPAVDNNQDKDGHGAFGLPTTIFYLINQI